MKRLFLTWLIALITAYDKEAACRTQSLQQAKHNYIFLKPHIAFYKHLLTAISAISSTQNRLMR
jgi:hypothetical protein